MPARISQKDADLRVLDPPGGAGVLALHADRLRALPEVSGFVNHEHGAGVAEVVGAAELRERPQVPGLAGEAVQVDQPLVDPVPEGVPDRSGAPVRDLAGDQGRQRGQRVHCGRGYLQSTRRVLCFPNGSRRR